MNKGLVVLAKRCRAELKALGIDPKTYHIATKFLNINVSYIVEFETNIVHLYWITKAAPTFPFPPSSEVTTNELRNEIRKMLGIPRKEASDIISEWLRDREIYHNLSENVTENWDVLNVPILYGTQGEEYNF